MEIIIKPVLTEKMTKLVIPQKKLDTLLKKEVLTKTTATKSKTKILKNELKGNFYV